MPIYFHLTPKGVAKLPEIKKFLTDFGNRRLNLIKPRLQALPEGGLIETSYPLASRFKNPATGQVNSTGLDEALAQMGVGLIQRSGPADNIVFTYGPAHSIDGIKSMLQSIKPENRPRAILHLIQTYYFPGTPWDNIQALQKSSKVNLIVTATGVASARGVAATGNLGAVNHLQIFGRILEAAVSVLNGGQGTRLFGLRKLKGDVLFGNNNLTIWNLYTALYFLSQMPASGVAKYHSSYHVTLANDGIFAPFGALTTLGEVLASVPESRVKEGYFFVSPDDPTQMSPTETLRFGMVALAKDGSFICATEKEGREATFKQAQAVLAARGQQVEKEEIRLYINYFGMATTKKLEEDMERALKTLIRPGLTADQIGDLDTYGLLFAVLSSDRPEELRAKIKKMGLNSLIAEPMTDQILFVRLRQVLFEHTVAADGTVTFRKDAAGNNIPRMGFAEFNRGAVALDIGTMPSLYGLYLDMVRTFDLEGETRDKILGYLGILERGGTLTPAQNTEFNELSTILATSERVVRSTSQRIAGFDPSKVIEGCEFEVDPQNPPIIGVATDDYTIPAKLQDPTASADVMRQIQDIVSAKQRAQLQEYHDPATGNLLFLYDPQGINTVKLVGSRIKSGAVIGRNTLVLNSEIGNGADTVIVAENGAVVASRVAASVTHKQVELTSQLELTEKLKEVARKGKGQHKLELPNGWNAIFTLVATDQSADLANQLVSRTQTIGTLEQRRIADIQSVLGIDNPNRTVTLNLNEGVGRIDISGPGGITGRAADPSKVYRFTLSFEKRKQPSFILYGRAQTNLLAVDRPTAYSSKQPVADAAAMDYAVPFDADPAKTLLALYGGIVMKDPKMQEEFGFYTRFRMRSNQELLPMASQIAQATQSLVQQLPMIIGMPVNTRGMLLPSINTTSMEATITTALNTPGRSLQQAIVEELIRQTPAILSQYIMNSVSDLPTPGVTQQQVSAWIAGLFVGRNRANRLSLRNIFPAANAQPTANQLNIADPQARRRIIDVLAKYPLSEMLFSDANETIATFQFVVDALEEQFRMTEIPIFEPPVEAVTGIRTLVDYDLDPTMAVRLPINGVAPAGTQSDNISLL